VTNAHTKPTIVVGYDGSDTARAALLYAARRARPGGHLYVVHAIDLPPDFLGSPYYSGLLTERRARGSELLGALSRGEDSLAEVDVHTELLGGPPAEAIAAVARARNADEIAIGARGLGRVRALLGSVSHELLHIADRPVVVIPSGAVEKIE